MWPQAQQTGKTFPAAGLLITVKGSNWVLPLLLARLLVRALNMTWSMPPPKQQQKPCCTAATAAAATTQPLLLLLLML
jgi:hypothetical protein